MSFTRNFKELNKNDADIAGGKGASLGEMTQAGIPVPPGFVVLSTSFDYFLKEKGFVAEIDSILDSVNHNDAHSIEQASERIQGLILNTEVPEDIRKEINASFEALGLEYVAVRSSATAEDGVDHAWAGQLNSYLNTTKEDVLEKVKHCWASLFTPRAIFYRFEKGLHKTNISIAVVIQKMIQSETSGIAFSVHPVTKDPNQLIIEAGYGLGEAIVSGAITPDSYIVEKDSKNIIDISVNVQTKALYRGIQGGVVWEEISEPQASAQVLANEQILELSNLVINIENHYGFPCDIEWAYEKGNFYVTQSRPITTLNSSSTELNESTYRLIFASDGFAVMNAFNLLNAGYIKYGGAIVAEDNNKVSLYIKNTDLHSYGEIGYSLFTSKEKVEQLIADIHEVSSSIAVVDQIHVTQTDLYTNVKLAESLKETSNLSTKFISLYGLLEPQYTYYTEDIITAYTSLDNEGLKDKNIFDVIFKDRDCIKDQKIKNICENVATLAEFKLATKEKMNDLFKGHSALVREARKRFELTEIDDIRLLSCTEICDFLLTGFTRDIFDKKVEERKKWFVILNDSEGKQSIYNNIEAKNIIDDIKKENTSESIRELKGQTASVGMYTGRAIVIPYIRSTKDEVYQKALNEFKLGDVLVTKNSVPEIIEIIKKASAIVTEEGGITCHGAIMSREFNVPGIVGVDGCVDHIKTGDIIEVDARGVKGKIRIITEAI
jgi:phosphoenolpyruvate synthase/pyruvate phosphate dikinase